MNADDRGCRARLARTARPAFSLVELITTLAIIVVLTTVIAGGAIAVIRHARIRAAAESLENLAAAAAGFRKDIGDYPLNLTQLSIPITAASLNSCGQSYSAAQIANWRGPYLPQLIEAPGADVGIGAAPDLMFETGGYTIVPVEDVDIREAEDLDSYVDGGNGGNDGAVRWVPASGELVTIAYLLAADGC